MNRLMRAEEWARRRFTPESRPNRKTLHRWLAEGIVPGKQVGRNWYVDVDAEARATGDELVDAVLQG